MDEVAPNLNVSLGYAPAHRHAIMLASESSVAEQVRPGPSQISIPRAIRARLLQFERNALKRGIDIVAALALAVVFAPLIILVVLSSWRAGGDILFTQARVGKGGKIFKARKFRTMAPDADRILMEALSREPEFRAKWQSVGRLQPDPRLTRIGKLLRATQLDRIPQIWNVMVGDMSIVGPKPISREEIERLGSAARFYLSCKPGLTGLWQVNGNPAPNYLRQVALDRRYALISSTWTDLVIMINTVRLMLRLLISG